jgi:hypothetical protein
LVQVSIDGYVQGFPETTFLKPTPLVLALEICIFFTFSQRQITQTTENYPKGRFVYPKAD